MGSLFTRDRGSLESLNARRGSVLDDAFPQKSGRVAPGLPGCGGLIRDQVRETRVFGRRISRNGLFWAAIFSVVVLLTVAILVARNHSAATPASVAFTDFLRDVDAARRHRYRDDGGSSSVAMERRSTVAPQGYIASNPTFVSGLAQRGIRLDASGAVVQCWAVRPSRWVSCCSEWRVSSSFA